MEKEVDVLVVGGCSAGLFFAERMAKQGYKTLVIEKDPADKLAKRYDIFHLAKQTFERFAVPIPQHGDSDFVQIFSEARSRSALDNYPKVSSTEEVLVLHRHQFMQRLARLATQQGAEILYQAQFLSPIIDNDGNLAGATIKHLDQTHTVKARLVVDASGISSVVRRSLPDHYQIEKFEIGPKDKFFVVLYYATLKNPQQDRMKATCGWPYYKTWIAPQQKPEGVILGIGANYSYQYAEYCFQKFAEKITLPDYEIDCVEKGTTPYHRTPYSFVENNFICLGDAACLTNPWNGEGVTFGWEHAEIAAKVASRAMQNFSIPTKEKLWLINKEYYQTYGVQNVQLIAMLASGLDCSPQENDYEFKQSIIFEDQIESQSGNIFTKMIKGVLIGKLKLSTLTKLIKAALLGNQIGNHYQNYPETPQHFEQWSNKADIFWDRCITIDQISQNDYQQFLEQK